MLVYNHLYTSHTHTHMHTHTLKIITLIYDDMIIEPRDSDMPGKGLITEFILGVLIMTPSFMADYLCRGEMGCLVDR